MTEVLHRQVPVRFSFTPTTLLPLDCSCSHCFQSLVAVEESAAESVAAVVACSVEAFPRFLRKPRTVPHPLLQEDPVLSLEEALPHPHLPLAASIHLQVVANLHVRTFCFPFVCVRNANDIDPMPLLYFL